ncbi:MAG: hypothetical protein Q9P14_18500 [candidate division KSB1 bacterium]|nr:hypothetical protein [candidate division KSB1 bacterium]
MRHQKRKIPVTIHIDRDILDIFKRAGREDGKRISTIIVDYLEYLQHQDKVKKFLDAITLSPDVDLPEDLSVNVDKYLYDFDGNEQQPINRVAEPPEKYNE